MVEISVIIPTYNEEKYIENTLKAFKNQTFKDFELIVADYKSKDKTIEIAKKYAKVVTTNIKGISAGRNVGASKANGRIFVFIDADTVPSPNTLEAYHDAFKNKKIIMATCPIAPLGDNKIFTKMGYFLVSVVFVKLLIHTPFTFMIGSNFVIRKDAFNKLNGFDPKVKTCEDLDLAKRARKIGKAKFVNNTKVYSHTRRVEKWGMLHYAIYHTNNYFRYYLHRKIKEDYENIR
ncbi:MAG: glycosyltransferase [Candidatus Marsarchaeota archaeon]|jgi:glycosyltransferase involved in cell wall biosynthesis|nr:glycosyltransferase [Candidatus Marsarchaeota archaeon]